MQFPVILVVCGLVATKSFTGISANMGNVLHKINNVIDNDVIIVGKLDEETVKIV